MVDVTSNTAAQPVYIVDGTGSVTSSSATGTKTSEVALANFATGQIAVATTATLVVGARAGRQRVTLSPTTSVVYYIGAAGVTAATGLYVAAGSTITILTQAAVYALGASAFTISYIENF